MILVLTPILFSQHLEAIFLQFFTVGLVQVVSHFEFIVAGGLKYLNGDKYKSMLLTFLLK